jgi:hypothetical protein
LRAKSSWDALPGGKDVVFAGAGVATVLATPAAFFAAGFATFLADAFFAAGFFFATCALTGASGDSTPLLSTRNAESARDLWRLQPLRRWSHEQAEQVLT